MSAFGGKSRRVSVQLQLTAAMPTPTNKATSARLNTIRFMTDSFPCESSQGVADQGLVEGAAGGFGTEESELVPVGAFDAEGAWSSTIWGARICDRLPPTVGDGPV